MDAYLLFLFLCPLCCCDNSKKRLSYILSRFCGHCVGINMTGQHIYYMWLCVTWYCICTLAILVMLCRCNKCPTGTLIICNSLLWSRSCESCLFIEETQNQPKASHALHHVSAPGPGEEVQTEAVSVHRWAGWVLLLLDPDRDSGEDLVSEPQGKSQTAPGGWAGETQDGHQRQGGCSSLRWRPAPWLHVTAGRHVTVRADLLCLPPAPQTHTAHFTFRPVHCSSGLQHVPLIKWKYHFGVSQNSQKTTERTRRLF